MQQLPISKATESKNWIVSGKITKKGEVKTGSKNGNEWAMCNVSLKDHLGEGQITLWNEEIDQVHVGKSYSIHGYTKEYDGKKSLAVGKYGKIEPYYENDENQATIDAMSEGTEEQETFVEHDNQSYTKPKQSSSDDIILEKLQLSLDCNSAVLRILVDLQLAKKEDLPEKIKTLLGAQP